jgi:hypothetical protein
MEGPRTSRQGKLRTPLSPGPFPLPSQGKGSGPPESPPSSSAGGGIERGGVQHYCLDYLMVIGCSWTRLWHCIFFAGNSLVVRKSSPYPRPLSPRGGERGAACVVFPLHPVGREGRPQGGREGLECPPISIRYSGHRGSSTTRAHRLQPGDLRPGRVWRTVGVAGQVQREGAPLVQHALNRQVAAMPHRQQA